MATRAKICGLSDPANLKIAVAAGADMVGFMFYPPSPRAVSPARAAELAATLPATVTKVGVFVDPSDGDLAATLAEIDLDYLQLHGDESPERVAAIARRFKRPILKAIKIRLREDLEQAGDYQAVADILLFDAKAPADMADALPGGNGVPFDWNFLKDAEFDTPWMLGGGLSPDNIAAAIGQTGAQAVDVSSGVESTPGKKDPARIKAFLDAVRRL